jgi:DNA polymerase III delta prime subunit
MQTDSRYVATSVSRRIIARMQATHERRRISVFSGPPGIGKTTAIDQWRRGRPDAIAVVKIGRQNAKEAMTLQHTLEAVRRLTGESFTYVPTSIWELRKDLFGAICRWADADPLAARKGEYDPAAFGRLTIVYDEAQNLSRQAIEALRYWNDSDRCYAPFPVGLVFVGNSEFSLAGGPDGSSVISAAVADRALYIQSLEYDELTDDDISLVVQDRGVEQFSAVAEIVRAFKGPRAVRSLRRVLDIIDDAICIAAGGPITQDAVRSALNYA